MSKSLDSLEAICSTPPETLERILFDYFIPISPNTFVNRMFVAQIVADRLSLEDQAYLDNPNIMDYRDYPKATIEDVWNFSPQQLLKYMSRQYTEHKTYNQLRTSICYTFSRVGRFEESDRKYLSDDFSGDALARKRRDYTVNILEKKFDEINLAAEVAKYDDPQWVAILVGRSIEIRDSNSLALINGLILSSDVNVVTVCGDKLFFMNDVGIYYWDILTNRQEFFINTPSDSQDYSDDRYLSVFSKPNLKIYDLSLGSPIPIVNINLKAKEWSELTMIYTQVEDELLGVNALTGQTISIPGGIAKRGSLYVRGNHILIGTKDELEIYDLKTLNLLQTIRVKEVECHHIDIPSNRLVLLAQGKLYVYDLTTFDLLYLADYVSDWELPSTYDGKFYLYRNGDLEVLDLTTFQWSAITYGLDEGNITIFEQ
jgi:hypothetical protein